MEAKQKIFILSVCRNFALIITMLGIVRSCVFLFVSISEHGGSLLFFTLTSLITLAAYFFRRFCIKKLAQFSPAEMETSRQIVKMGWLITGGIFLGALVGFLLRPSVPIGGQLPFYMVISRGATLQGLDQILIPTAQKSFNCMLVGAIIGGVVGFVVPKVLDKNKPTN